MTDTDLSGVRVIPEDKGTGGPFDAQNGDYVSGGDLLALASQDGDGGYIEHGFGVTYDGSTETIDVDGGYLFASYEAGVTVQQSDANVYDFDLNIPVAFGCYSAAGATDLSVAASSVNDVWVSIDLSVGDSAVVRHGAGLSAPAAPALKIAEVDTSTGEVTPFNSDPSATFEQASVTSPPSAADDVTRKADLDAHTGDASNPHTVSLEQARQQDNTFVGSVNFAASGFNVGSGQFALTPWSMIFASHNQTERGDTGTSRLLEKKAGGTLSINPDGDFFGGVNVGSQLSELGTPVLTEDDTARFQPAPTNTDVSTANGDYAASWGETVFVDASSGPGTITLPPPEDGPRLTVKKVDESPNRPSLATPGSQSIDGESTYPITNPYDALEVTDNGTNYYLI